MNKSDVGRARRGLGDERRDARVERENARRGDGGRADTHSHASEAISDAVYVAHFGSFTSMPDDTNGNGEFEGSASRSGQ